MWLTVNRVLNAIFDLFLWPVQSFSSEWQVLVLSFPVAVLALIVFRSTSNQTSIVRTKNKISAYFLELRLYRDDIKVIVRALGRVFKHIVIYMRLAIVPMAVMIVPFALVLIQVESRFAFDSFENGDAMILGVIVDGAEPIQQRLVELSLPEELVKETPVLRVESTRELLWRLRASAPGDYQIGIEIGADRVEKRVVVGRQDISVSPKVFRANDVRTLVYPMEPALDRGAEAVTIHLDYPRSGGLAGLSTESWILFGGSLLFGFAMRGLFDVNF